MSQAAMDKLVHSLRFPDWVVLHVPHDSDHIPASARSQFVLGEADLQRELVQMIDHHTYDLFKAGASPDQCVRAEVSRLVVDVERFVDDANEPMSARGMGVIYTMTANQLPLRCTLTGAERQELLDRYYYPHHARLEALVDEKLSRYGKCLVIDCHSFPSYPLPYELDQSSGRPDICIGTDESHTPQTLADAFVSTFEDRGFRVSVNSPFGGALVPIRHYQTDARVSAVMVEVNRRLYLNEETGLPLDVFEKVSLEIASACQIASKLYQAMPIRQIKEIQQTEGVD